MASDIDKNIPAISVKDLTVRFYNETVLSGVNFEIPKGAISAIIGPNGSGKTTLLRALLGFIPSEEGKIKFFGEDAKKRRARLSYVPQHFAFDRTFPITIREFLSLVPPSREHTPEEALREVGMEAHLDQLLGTLSGGELQRVLIARAVLEEPEIMLLDEPIMGVDVAGIKKFYELIEFLNKKHKTTIMLVLHEIDAVYHYARHVVCLNKNVICEGMPHAVLTPETLRQLYGKEVESTRLPEEIHG